MEVDFESIVNARNTISDLVRRTPFEKSETLSSMLGANVFVKYELFQKTGSFKVRGTFNKLLRLSPDEKKRGIVAVSGGNHAQAVAYAASKFGIDAVIVMPENTPNNYLNATRDYGATVDLVPTISDAFERMREYESGGRVQFHPFDDRDIIAGQGTLGLEVIEDLPDATDVFVSIGGGGLASGVALACKNHNPQIRIWGVETQGADAMSQSLAAGKIVELASITSIAKTLGAPYVCEATMNTVARLFEEVVVVSDREALDCMKLIAERLKVVTEPAASCTLAAALALRERFTKRDNVVLIFCGGNFALTDFCRFDNEL